MSSFSIMLPPPPLVLLLLLPLLLVLPHGTTSYDSVTSGRPHIADVNILLPPKMTYPVEYRLQGTDGCFKWSWDHHDILALLPEYNSSSHCSTSARLKSIAPFSGRKETAVYATEVNTGMVIRCKVYIDIFSRIQIFHNSIKLDLDGLATLRVRAFDSEENVFSSLVGLQFMWQLIPETEGLPHNLVHVPLKDSPQSDCGGLCGDLDIQVKLEDSGAFSDLYMVKGIEIGHELVSVHLVEPSFEHMEDKIILTVAEAMSLDPPSPVFVLIGGVLRYNLKVIRENVPQVVSLPSPLHRWSVLNSSVALVDRMTGEAYALNLGVTTVVVEDTRVAGHSQMSSLHVVLPDTLLLFLLPLSPSGSLVEGMKSIPSVARWYVVSGRKYLIYVKVFSQGPGAHEIYVTETDDVKLDDDHSEFWNILPVSDSVAAREDSKVLETISYGLGKLTATLTYRTGHGDTKEVMKVVQEVMVCDQVKFSINKENGEPQRILLPWAPSINQELELKATGGCAMAVSDYRWFSSNMEIVSVSASGVVQSKNPGKATIKAASIYDILNYDEVVIEVSVPSLMVMQQNFPVEIPVGSHLQASVTLKAPDGSYFDRCDAFSSFIKWKTESQSLTIINTTGESHSIRKREMLELQRSSYGPVCALTLIYASKSGCTKLHATFTKEYQELDHSVGGYINLQSSLQIAAYTPLIVHEVSDGNQFGGYQFNLTEAKALNRLQNLDCLYLVPGTNFDVMLHGGPEKWGQGVEFIETLEIFGEKHSYHKDAVLVHQVYAEYGTLYRVVCAKNGDFKLIFKRGNLIGDDHPLPAVSELQLLLRCDFPSSIALIIDEPVNSPEAILSAIQADRTQQRIRATSVTVANGRRIRLSAVGVSDTGKAFGNSSSLNLNWELSDCAQLVLWDDAYNLAKTKSSWERFLVLLNASGLCTVRATVVGYHETISHIHVNAPFESFENALTDSVRLQVVSSLRVNPEFSLLFFSNDARMNISIAGGSCFLSSLVNDSRILEVIELPQDLQCLQLMLAPKRLGTALVTLHDMGLAPPLAASSVVQVADVDWIKITSGEEISLMEGNLLSINFVAGTDEGHVFDSSQHVYMKIKVHIEDHIVELVDNYNLQSLSDGYVRAPNFTVRGAHLGVATLYLSARQHSGAEVLSQSIKVEVYAPPRVYPSDIFLVPGASFVLTIRGGPTFGAHVEYASTDHGTAKVHKSSGQLSAISPGNTTLVATFYRDGDIMICQAYGKVKVGVPPSAVLNVQSEQLAVGRKMSVFPSLSEGNLFSFYELCSNYKWTIKDEEILGVHGADSLQGVNHAFSFPTADILQSTDYLDEGDLGFLKVLQGRSPGKTDIRVSFSCDFRSTGSFSESRLYTAFISLWVISDLPLALGSPITWILPPHYTSSDLLPLPSNYGKGDAVSQKGTIAYSLLGQRSGKTGEVQDDVIFIDGSKIKTKESDSLACIQAKDKSTGRTEVASCVRVAEVAQARIMTEDVLVLKMAVGTALDLPIQYYDVLGNPFHEAYNVTLFEAGTNYPDIVAIKDSCDGGKIHLRAKGQGKALIQMRFTNKPQKSDYVIIFVGAQLYPLNPVLHVGRRLNFSVEGLSGQASGKWFSANNSILYVDMSSGEAKAVSEGSTHVYYEESDLKLQTKVTVLKGTSSMRVGTPVDKLTDPPPLDKAYLFYVKLGDGNKYEAVRNGEMLVDCKVDPPHVGYVEPRRDPDTGKLYCIFYPYDEEHLIYFVRDYRIRGEDIPISITALLGENNLSGSASVLFIGEFWWREMDEKSLLLNLRQSSKRNFITLGCNGHISVFWDGPDPSVRAINKEDSECGRVRVFEVKVAKRVKDKVIFKSPAKNQRLEVDGSYYEPEETDKAYIDSAGKVGIAIAVIVTLLVPFLLYCLFRHDRLEQRVGPDTARTAAPSTPVRSSPMVQNELSPRTPPQPFIDYVRRTIDETPYYRQDHRRGINPQYTY